MSHLLPPSIRPRLGRSRSHTSPSPSRPIDIGANAGRTNEQRSLTYRSAIDTIAPTDIDASETVALDESSESSQQSKRPHLHLHTHVPKIHALSNTSKHAVGATSNGKSSVKTFAETTLPAESQPQASTSKRDGAALNGAAFQTGALHRSAAEPWTPLSPVKHEKPGLRRTLSTRSTIRNAANNEQNLNSKLLSPTAFEATPASGNIRSSSPGRARGRPRAASDQSRPGMSRDPTLSSANTPESVSNAITLALERGERRRQVKFLSATSEDIIRLDREAAEAEEDMRTRLDSVSKEGLEITRRLDYTYYSLLERIGGLSSVVSQLQNLRSQVQQLEWKLEREILSLDRNIDSGIKGLRDAAEGRRTSQVQALENRMNTGKERAQALGDRLERARTKLRDWEQREAEWRRSTKKKFTIAWVVTGVAFLLVFILLALRSDPATRHSLNRYFIEEIQTARTPTDGLVQDSANKTQLDGNYRSKLDRRAQSVYIPEDVVALLKSGQSSSEGSSRVSTESRQDDPTGQPEPVQQRGHDSLRVFDEL